MRSLSIPLISWSLFACLAAGCGFDPQPGFYTACDFEGACPAGCRCVAGWICATDATDRAPWECRAEGPTCEADAECKVGCTCLEGTCAPAEGLADRIDGGYCAGGLAPTCMQSERLVSGPTELSEALTWAASTPGAHRIELDASVDLDWLVSQPLPPVPGLTYLDGNGVRLVGDGSQPGLEIDGVGVALSDLELAAFGSYGMRIEAGSRDVALFRLRVVDTASSTDPVEPNGHGIHIAGEAAQPVERVCIGRGRGLPCVEAITVAHAAEPGERNEEFDVNAIHGNAGDGIRVEQAEDVNLYGTWVGFDPLDDPGHGQGSDLANGGAGIRLLGVLGARVGAQRLLDSEARTGDFSPLPAYVGVGRSLGGGVVIEGGGRIEAPGLILGNAPSMVPYDQNFGPALRIEANDDYVHIGPSPGASGADAQHFAEIYSDGQPMIRVIGNRAVVWVRGMQLWSTGLAGRPPAGVEVVRAQAPVKLIHLTFVYHFDQAAVTVEDLQPGGRLELVNSLLFKGSTTDPNGDTVCPQPTAPAVFSHQAGGVPDPGAIQVLNNMEHCFPGWCQGDCGALVAEDNVDFEAGTFVCTSTPQAEPLVPTCPNVDAGRVIPLADHRPMHLIGSPDSPFVGCGPDVGFIECNSAACRSVDCP